jgi:hypothetical protein
MCHVYPAKRVIVNVLRWQASSYTGCGVRKLFTTQSRALAFDFDAPPAYALSLSVNLWLPPAAPLSTLIRTASALSQPLAVDIFTGRRVNAPAAPVEIQ